MRKVNLDGENRIKKTGHTSKGDQLKWKQGDLWYKVDYMGYEGLAETLVSHLLEHSTLSFPFVVYQPVQITYRGAARNGCVSRDFLRKNQTLIPLERLYRQNTGESLAVALPGCGDTKERIHFLVDWVETVTKLKEFGKYLTAMLEIDAFFLNEDRHTNNIAVLYDAETESCDLCPMFDQGLCLFADTSCDYPLGMSVEACIDHIEAKPFSRDFDEQLDAAEELYGVQVYFDFDLQDALAELAILSEPYPAAVRERVEELLRRQIRKYRYLMKKGKA